MNANAEKKFDPVADEAARTKIITCRVNLLMRNPFWGNLSTRLMLENADAWCDTMATDGRKFYYNTEFVNKLTDRELIFGIGHEILHCVYNHIGANNRIGDRNRQLFNIACDYAINFELVEYNIGEKITTVPILYDTKWKGMCAEEIYEKLYDEAEKIDISQLAEMVLDDHLEDDGSGQDEKDGKEGDEKSGGSRPRISAEDRQKIADEIKEAVLSAAQTVGIGNVPAGMKRFIKDITEPVMNWRDMLHQQVESQIRNDFTFMRPSRRSFSCDAILPSMKRDPALELTIAIDLSGSIGDKEMHDFLSEVVGIMNQYAAYNITIYTWDTQAYYTGTFTQDNDVSEMLEADYKGGGGTSPRCIWEQCIEDDRVPKQLIIFTDMYVDNFADEFSDVCPVIWLAYKNPQATATHGTTCHYD